MITYNTEIISVGTELLLGHVTNTDSRIISEMLSAIGINVKYHTVVGDNPQRLRDCVNIAKERADIIVTTGGLGPTCDDLTKQILAESFGLKLVTDPEERKFQDSLRRPDKVFTENNYKQAMLPEGCTIFHNTCGTAPGCAFEADGKTVIMLPGPPKECKEMFSHSAIPYLRKLSDEEIVSHSVRIFGIGESRVDDIFHEEMDSMTNPTMAPYAKECDCLVQITAKAKDWDEGEKMVQPVIDHVREIVGEWAYGVDVENLEEEVMLLLNKNRHTFALAESLTGGNAAKRFTDLPGASEFFLGGVVTYTNHAKSTLLGIDPKLIEDKGAVSEEVAVEMAQRVRNILGADIGLGLTGLAGPSDDGVNSVGTVYVSMATEEKTWTRRLELGKQRDRSFIRTMACNHAFDMMRRYLTGIDVMQGNKR